MSDNMVDTQPAFEMRLRRRLSVVPRWSVIPMLRQQSVADHSFQVASLCLWLMESHKNGRDPEFRLRVLTHAIQHDQDEGITGDHPSMSKGNGHPPTEVDQVKVLVKCADLLEALIWAKEEMRLGNSMVEKVVTWTGAKFEKWWFLFQWEVPKQYKLQSWEVLNLAAAHVMIPGYEHPAFEPMAEEWMNERS